MPALSEQVSTLAPKSNDFSIAYYDTFPEPDTKTFLPAYSCPAYFNMLSAKYTVPYPVASGLMSEPPHSILFPVKTPVN